MLKLHLRVNWNNSPTVFENYGQLNEIEVRLTTSGSALITAKAGTINVRKQVI